MFVFLPVCQPVYLPICLFSAFLSFFYLPACLPVYFPACQPASKPGSTFVTNLSRIGIMIFLFFCIVLVVLVGELRSKNWQSQIFRQNSSLSNFAFLVSKWPKRYTSSMLLIFFHWFLFRMILINTVSSRALLFCVNLISRKVFLVESLNALSQSNTMIL